MVPSRDQLGLQAYDLRVEIDLGAVLGKEVECSLQRELDTHLGKYRIGCLLELLQFVIAQDTPQVLGRHRPDELRVIGFLGHTGFLSFFSRGFPTANTNRYGK